MKGSLTEQANAQSQAYWGDYEHVAASQTDQVLGPIGAAGDHLHAIAIEASTGTITVKDGTTTVLIIPAGATGSWILDMVSVTGAWKITTPAGTSCTCIGKFT